MVQRVRDVCGQAMSGHSLQRGAEVGWERRTDVDLPARHRMIEQEPGCVEKMPFWWQRNELATATTPIGIVTADGMPYGSQVDADLMGASREEMRPQQVV